MLSGILLCEVLCDEHGTPVDHRFLSCNRASEVLTGVTAAELVGKTSIDAPIGWPLEVRARLYDVAMQGTTWQYDRVNETLGRHYETRVFSPRQGQFAHSFTDVTEQKRAEAQIRLDSAALAAANPILITDRTGRIESANDAFCAMTGYAMSEVIGETPTTLLKSGKQSPAFYAQLWQTILDGGVWRGEMVNRRKDGSLYTEESTITPLLDDQGQVTHFVTVKQDITDRQLLEAQFQQAQKMESVGRLAGGVAHDFNNMLSVILGRTELALMQLDADSPLRNDLEEVLSAGRHSADLTRQLLAFARRQTVSPRALDLNAEITKSLKLLRRLISEDIALQWLPAGTVWPVYLDPSQLDQILANLCVNARDAIEAARRGAPAGRSTADTVTISTGNCTLDAAFCASHLDATPGDYVRLRVADTGCGMSPDVMAKIFEPFFTTKPVGEGTGLGLATVFGAVRQNGGIITVDSRVDHGTSFEVFFRRSEAVEPTAAEPEESAPVGGHETILVVEDEPGVRRMTVFVLRRLGYTVLDAEDPVAALALESAHPGTIDLLITDMVMPEMSGTELVAALRQRRPGLRFRYMSGYTADDLTGPEHAEIRAHLIEKPIRPAELAIQVRTALDE
jgi:PAS domain S-box-containing protein